MSSDSFVPRHTVSELDRFIVGQHQAKRLVAIALRNRWRRRQLGEDLRREILPKNILMVGPTGVGKTEISRRLAYLAQAPFIKVEATKFTEVGYIGRDVEQIIRDLIETAVNMIKNKMRRKVRVQASDNAENRILDILTGAQSSSDTRRRFQELLRAGKLDDKEIEIELRASSKTSPMLELSGTSGMHMGMININDLLGNVLSPQKIRRKIKVSLALTSLLEEESDKLLDEEKVVNSAIEAVEQSGIVFIDEIDKICHSGERRSSGEVSREGVQRDLLPLIEGTNISTRYGLIDTGHILFIASGAFHSCKPSDLMPELQGRLPLRVELDGLGEKDFIRILREPENSLIIQYQALMSTENFTLRFTDRAIEEIANIAALINDRIENIGARRLHTVMEKLLEDISFSASERGGEKFTITPKYVREKVLHLATEKDISRFIL